MTLARVGVPTGTGQRPAWPALPHLVASSTASVRAGAVHLAEVRRVPGKPRKWKGEPGTGDLRPPTRLSPVSRGLAYCTAGGDGPLQPTLPTPVAPDAQGGNQWGEKGVSLKGFAPRKVASGRLSLTADNHSKVVYCTFYSVRLSLCSDA